MYGNQNLYFNSVSRQTPFVQSMRFTSDNSSNGQIFAETSRKRKFMDMDVGHDGLSARFLESSNGNLGHLLPREQTSQHNVALTPPLDFQMLFNHNSEQADPSNAESQYRAFQFYNTDNSLQTSETKDENIKKYSFRSMQSFPVHTLQEIFKREDSTRFVSDIPVQYELSKFPPYYGHHSGLREMSQVTPRLDDDEHNRIPCNPSLYPLSTPNNMATCYSTNLMVVNENFHSDLGVGQNFSNNRQYEGKEYGQVMRLERANSISIGKTEPTHASVLSEGSEAYERYQNSDTVIRSESSNYHDNLGSDLNHKENKGPLTSLMPVQTESSPKELDHVSSSFEKNICQRDEGLNTDNTNDLSGEETLLRSVNSLANRLVEPNGRQAMNLEELNQSAAEKTSPLMAEKLWDGSLQLNTSTTVSAVAVFKSGEKAQDTKWPEHVEVKGKVRLQAFEKYIQELPRSRNRALMVISLCWKPGSPDAGLAGMKEVAKGYRDGQKVGFAQICPGFDLYVCPRCDTIITILAKYGFFKGMGAVEDNQDSLIGCVIWRRDHTSSNPVPKISEEKKTQLPEAPFPITQVDISKRKQEKPPSPHNASLHAENGLMPYSSPLIQVQPPFAQNLESNPSQETLRDTDKAAESKNLGALIFPRPGVLHQTYTQTSDDSQKFRSHSYIPRPELGASISSNFTFIGAQMPSMQNPVQSNSKQELAQPALLGALPLPPEFFHRNREASKPPTEGATKGEASFMPTGEPKHPEIAQQNPADLEDDDDSDLPEFDFNFACGVSKESPLSAFPRTSHQKHPEIGSLKNENGLLARPLNTYQGSNTHVPTRFGELNSEKKPADVRSLSHQFPGRSDKGFLSSNFLRKNCWDDDDMPEWCPPDLEHLDAPKPSPSTRVPPMVSRPMSENAKESHLNPPPYSMTTFRPPLQSLGSSGYRPRGSVLIDVGPPQVPHPSNSMGSTVKNFGGKYSASVSWQWKRY